MLKQLSYLAAAAALGAALALGINACSTANAPTIPSANAVYYASANAVSTAENVAMTLLASHKITPAQAQGVADQCRAIRLAIAAAEAASAPAGSAQSAAVDKAVATLQAYITEISR